MFARSTLRGVRLGVLVIVAMLATVYFVVSCNDRPPNQQQDGATSASTMIDYQSTLLIVGDSYGATYPALVAEKMGWHLALDAQDGTGFVRRVDDASPARVPFIERLDGVVATYHVDYVLVDGGRNDHGEPPEQVAAAADEYLTKVRSSWPKAKIIIVLPSYATDMTDSDPAVADGLRRTAESAGAYLIDPVAQRWYRDVDGKSLLGLDGTHLSVNGDSYYADKIIENLKQMFERKPTLLLVGDSFARGTGDPGFVTYPYVVADRMGWNLALDAQYGTGFVHGVDNLSPPLVPFIDRLDGVAATYHYHVEYVLIDGGRSDLGEPPDPVVAAAGEYIAKVHSEWPNATIIIVLPSYATPDVAGNYPVVAQGLRRAAESVGAHVIDPVAQRWYRDIDMKPLLWRDGVHLNGDGNIYYANKIVENLKHLGLAS